MSDKPVLVDIGSGDRPYSDGREWVHVDSRRLDDIEIVGEIPWILDEFDFDSVDEIMARHILEHFPYNGELDARTHTLKLPSIDFVMKCIYEILKPGGILHIEVPNIAGHIRGWMAGEETDDELVTFLYGGQDYPDNIHYNGFTPRRVYDLLYKHKFNNININDIGMVVVASCSK